MRAGAGWSCAARSCGLFLLRWHWERERARKVNDDASVRFGAENLRAMHGVFLEGVEGPYFLRNRVVSDIRFQRADSSRPRLLFHAASCLGLPQSGQAPSAFPGPKQNRQGTPATVASALSIAAIGASISSPPRS